MIELFYVIVGVVIGAVITYFLDRRLLKKIQEKEEKDNIDTILSSMDLEVNTNLKIARDNQRNANQGRSPRQKHNFSNFSFTAYDKFSTSINIKLKDKLGDKAIEHLTDGYNQCRKFNSDFNLYKNGIKPTSRLTAPYFNNIIINFEEYLKLRKCE